MDSRPYGNTALRVSVLTYGAMTIARDPELRGGVAPSLLAALERGVTTIDTARAYGESEAIVARTLREWRGPRPIVSTKLLPVRPDAWRHHLPSTAAYPVDAIRSSVEASLQALGVETLDIVHLHQWYYSWTHEPEWREALDGIVRAGKVRCVAISAQDHEHDAVLEAVSRRLVDGVQVIVNAFESRPAVSLLPLAWERGAGVIARCVLDSGGLSGELGADDFAGRLFLKHAPYAEYGARLEALRRDFVPSAAASLTELALRFVLSLDGVSTMTVGLPTRKLVDDTAAAVEKGPLDADVLARIRRHHVWTRNFYERLV